MQMKKLSPQKDEESHSATTDDREENEFQTQTHERVIPVSVLGFVHVVEYINRNSRSEKSCAEHSQHQDEDRSPHVVVEAKYIGCKSGPNIDSRASHRLLGNWQFVGRVRVGDHSSITLFAD